MQDGQIVELYWQKNTDAITETNNKYGAYCFAIVPLDLSDRFTVKSKAVFLCPNDCLLLRLSRKRIDALSFLPRFLFILL